MKRKNKCTDILVDSTENKEIKRMNIAEFQELGYLQEVNRQFFHPLGLALELLQDETGTKLLSGIWDYREDVEGIYYDLKNSDEDRIKRFQKNRDFINDELNKRIEPRKKLFGNIIEPIPKDEK